MKYNQELLEKRKILVRGIETLERKLKDKKKVLSQVKEKLRGDDDVINHGRNMKDDTDGYESGENTSEEKHKTRKRKNDSDERKADKKIRTVYRIIEKLGNKIEEKESKDNVQQTDTKSLAEQATEIINGYGILKEQEALLKLRWYNYAESFQMRIKEEIEGDLSISEQTARTRIYREIQGIKKLSERDYTRLRKMTNKAERFYRVIEEAGGKDKIKYLSGISVDAVTKLRKEELENLYRGLNAREEAEKDGRIYKIVHGQNDT